MGSYDVPVVLASTIYIYTYTVIHIETIWEI